MRASVLAYYVNALNKNDWVLVAYSGDIATRVSATFQRSSNANAKGSLDVTNAGGPTTISRHISAVGSVIPAEDDVQLLAPKGGHS